MVKRRDAANVKGTEQIGGNIKDSTRKLKVTGKDIRSLQTCLLCYTAQKGDSLHFILHKSDFQAAFDENYDLLGHGISFCFAHIYLFLRSEYCSCPGSTAEGRAKFARFVAIDDSGNGRVQTCVGEETQC